MDQFVVIDRQTGTTQQPRRTELGIAAALSDNESVPDEPANPTGVAGGVADRVPAESTPSSIPLQVAPRELVDAVEAFSQATSLNERTAALISLVGWIRKSGTSVADLSGLQGAVEYLETNTEQRTRFQTAFAELLAQLNCVSLFAEAGIPSDHSFLSEIGYRISARVFPPPANRRTRPKSLATTYPNEENARRFLASPTELFQRLVAVLTPPDDPLFASHEYQDLLEALRLLSSRVSSLGLGAGSTCAHFVARSVRLAVLSDLAPPKRSRHAARTPTASRHDNGWSRCRPEMAQVHHHMESAGVSVELIFDLKRWQRVWPEWRPS